VDGVEEVHPGEASHVVVEEADKGSSVLGKLSVSCKVADMMSRHLVITLWYENDSALQINCL